MSLTKALDKYIEAMTELTFIEDKENLEEEIEEIKSYIHGNIDNSLKILKYKIFDDRIELLKSKVKELNSMIKTLEAKKNYFEGLTADAIKTISDYHTFVDEYTGRLYYVYPELSVRNEINQDTIHELHGDVGKTILILKPEELYAFREVLPDIYDRLESEKRIKYEINVTDIKESNVVDKSRYLITKMERKVKFRLTKKKEEE